MTLLFPSPTTSPAQQDLRGRTVLVFHAHPDDEAIFTGVTMRRLADAGARVVLVTATAGELGEVLVPLGRGEPIARRRAAELERAAGILGVARLHLLPYRDSGLPGSSDQDHPNALARADPWHVAWRLADLAVAERADALVHYDRLGIYGHPDHIAVQRIGEAAARLAGLGAYESTVDREHLKFAGADAHLVHAASRATASVYGHVTAEIPLAIAGDEREVEAKRAAIRAHASQVRPEAIDHEAFRDAYELEWYMRSGPPGVLDRLGNAHSVA